MVPQSSVHSLDTALTELSQWFGYGIILNISDLHLLKNIASWCGWCQKIGLESFECCYLSTVATHFFSLVKEMHVFQLAQRNIHNLQASKVQQQMNLATAF